MTITELKTFVSLENYFKAHGSTQDAQSRWRCLCTDRHTNGDVHHSCTIENGRARCWSQECFGKKGADIFGVVGVVEHFPDFKSQKRRVEELAGVPVNGDAPLRQILRRFRYRDAQNREAWKLRWNTDEPGKKCTWARDPDGLVSGKGDCQPTLYQLEQIEVVPNVIQCEGERDADTVNACLKELGIHDIVATTTPNGAGDVKLAYLAPLFGKATVWCSGDNDLSGRGYQQKCGAILHGHVNELRLLSVPEGKDWTAWKEAGATAEDFRRLLEDAPLWRPEGETRDTEQTDRPREPSRPDSDARYTDVGNGERFARQHRETVRYCYGLKQWFVWDGQRWHPDDGGEITMLAKQTARSLYREAEGEPDDPHRKTIVKWAVESETERRLKSMVSLAQSEPGLAIEAEKLDADPLLLNVLNGTLDLRTGTLRAARRADFITKLVPVHYRPEVVCHEFERLLDRVFENVPAVRQYLQRIFGYSLTGLTIEQCFFLFHGVGANGKSTILRAILDLLGDYATTTRPETFLTKRGDGIPNDVAALAGARFVLSLESEQGKRLAEALVKGVTGGDKLSARFLHREFFTFAPQLKFFIGTNHKPTIRGTDHAMWRRVRCIPFAVVIPDHEQDKHLSEKLRAEYDGILNWLVQGCLAWQRDGLGPPLEVQQATADYRAEQDTLGVFLKDRCVLEPTAKSVKKELYQGYVVWCDEGGERHRLTMREFTKALREQGMVDAKVGNAKGCIGLRLRTPLDVEPDEDELVAAQPEVVTDES